MNKLIQEKGFFFKSFELQEDEVRVTSKNFEKESEYSLDYLNLGVRTYRHAEKKARIWQWMLWLTISLGLFTLILDITIDVVIIGRGWLGILLILSSLLILWFKLKQEPSMIHLIGGEDQLEIIASAPNEKDVENFLKNIKERIKKAYRNQYLANSDDTSHDEKRSRIEWLHEIKIISRSEKDSLIDNLEKEKARGIGFRV